MAKVKDGQEALITRAQYNALKRMDRPEAEAFLKIIYDKGYTAGCRDTDSKHEQELDQAVTAATTDQKKEFKDEFFSILTYISGIGPVTLKKIKAVLDKWSV